FSSIARFFGKKPKNSTTIFRMRPGSNNTRIPSYRPDGYRPGRNLTRIPIYRPANVAIPLASGFYGRPKQNLPSYRNRTVIIMNFHNYPKQNFTINRNRTAVMPRRQYGRSVL